MGSVIYGITLSVFLAFDFMSLIEFEFIVAVCIFFSAAWNILILVLKAFSLFQAW